MPPDDELKRLRFARGLLKGTVTRMEQFTSDTEKLTSASSTILEARKEKLIKTFTEYETLQVDILMLDDKDTENVAIVENLYFSVLAKLTAQIDACKPSVSQVSSSSSDVKSSSKLPCIDIPTFSGKDFTKYTPFMDLFKAVVDKNASLSDVQKLFYLRKFLADEALSVIINLPLVNDSYKEALDLLQKRFDNKARIISSHINVILDMPAMKIGTAASIRTFVAGVQQQLYALKNLQQPVNEWGMLLLSILIRKLDSYTNRAYHLDRNLETLPTVSGLIEFLEKRAIALEDSSNPVHASEVKDYKKFTPKVTNVATMKVKNCLYCGKADHALYACPKFKMSPIEDRLSFVYDKKLCSICLRKHDGTCTFNFTCLTCKGSHNTLLHNENDERVALVNHVIQTNADNVLLPTIKVKLYDKRGKDIIIRALLDGCAMGSLITRSLVEKLNLTPKSQASSLIGVCGNNNKMKQYVEFIVHSPVNEQVQVQVKCNVVDTITSDLPLKAIDPTKLKMPDNIVLSDNEFHKPGPMNLLLGAEVNFKIISLNGNIEIPDGPFLQKTLFGFAVAGSLPDEYFQDQCLVNNFIICNDHKLEDVMEQFWLAESIPEQKVNLNKEFQKAENCFQDTTTLIDNKFQVNMPIVVEMQNLELGDSFSVSKDS